MTNQHHMKSVISIGNVDDTSLALPSESRQRSGPQRVLDQVQSVRRTKSKSSTTTSLSPTSPSYDSVFAESFRSSNGSVFFANGSSKPLSPDKTIGRQILSNSKGSTMNKSAFLYERSYPLISSMMVNHTTNTSRSEPEMAWQHSMPKRSVSTQRTLPSKSTYKTQRTASQFVSSSRPQPQLQPRSPSQPLPLSPSQPLSPSHPLPPPPPAYVGSAANLNKAQSQFLVSQADVSKVASKPPATETMSKTKEDSGVNGGTMVADITMKEAVEYLSNEDQTYQHCGASYIQHNTFINDAAKLEVWKLNGVRPLVNLLRSPSSQVSHTAAAALRNLSFKNDKNKEEIQRYGGIAEAVAALKETNSVDTQKQLTGLLWNLSSSENLKPDLLKSALPVLVDHVVLPYTTGPNRTSIQDPDVFFNATGCLRNLSSAKQSSRQSMRKCRGLIDSLATYVDDCVASGKPDDESVENCVCILHNLTFQLEAEAPALFSRITALSNIASRSSSQSSTSPVGCFSPQNKPTEHEPSFDFPVIEESQPSGAGWLIHSKTLQNYLSLLSTSQREETQEACCGALQNLTARDGIVSNVMGQTIVQKLSGLQMITPLIQSKKVNLQKNIVNLVGNLTKNPNLHNGIARKALPELLSLLSKGTSEGNESDDTLAMACHTASCMLLKKPDISKHLLSNGLIQSLSSLSQDRYLPKSSKAAALLLHNLWSHKDLQNHLKKQGMSKTSFVNDITTAAHRSVQVVD
ncbi:plakophilin-1 [Salarias fasciatus]|uniref:Plakophilin-1-like n=1 Tax=Salarias fasciatus TaxID=181472 RepID=A0A672F514_SALFA|nr:plakophilin-1-like [Salarias fasciatus]